MPQLLRLCLRSSRKPLRTFPRALLMLLCKPWSASGTSLVPRFLGLLLIEGRPIAPSVLSRIDFLSRLIVLPNDPILFLIRLVIGQVNRFSAQGLIAGYHFESLLLVVSL